VLRNLAAPVHVAAVVLSMADGVLLDRPGRHGDGFWIGQAVTAMADDGPIVGPDLGSAGGQTVFEQYGPQKFTLYMQLSDSNHGAPYVSQTMWEILRAIESALTYMVFLLARGAITSMEWLLNLHIYSDNSAEIDSAVRAVAAQVFWPLFGATLAIGAFSAYARMKREGGGTLFSDASWLVAASIFAVAFVSGPSLVMSDLDNLRTDLASAAMTGYSSYAPAGASAAGFPASNLSANQAGATRKLADAMWNVYVVAPWCYVNFNSMSECSDLGKDYIQGDARWQHEVAWMCGSGTGCNDVGGNSDDTKPPYCPKELNSDCDWIRGQSFGRLGAALFVTLIDIPLVAMLLVLVLYGIMAILGFIMLLLLGVFFVLGWMIPGRLRQMGVRWFEEVLGALLQSVIITAVIGSVMVIDAILNLAIPKYGFFMVGLLNLATFIVGFRLRGKLENITGIGSGTSSPFSNYMAMRAVGSVGKGVMRMGIGAGKGAAAAAPILAGAGMGMARAGGQLANAGYRGGAAGIRAAGRRVTSMNNTLLYGTAALHRTATRPNGGVAAPYRGPSRPGGSSGPGRPVIEPVRRRDINGTGSGTNGSIAELPVGAGADIGRHRELPAAAPSTSGMGEQPTSDGSRRFVDGSAGTSRRAFVAGTDGTTARAGSELASRQRRPVNPNGQGVVASTRPALPPGRAAEAYSAPPTRLAVNERASARPTPYVPDAYTSTRRIPPVAPASASSSSVGRAPGTGSSPVGPASTSSSPVTSDGTVRRRPAAAPPNGSTASGSAPATPRPAPPERASGWQQPSGSPKGRGAARKDRKSGKFAGPGETSDQ